MAELLRLATAGLGRRRQVDPDRPAPLRRQGDLRGPARGDPPHQRAAGQPETDLALLTDGLRAEREQGITIDVAYRYFATPKRKFIIADTPGHTEYTRNMVTGASSAHLSLILIDARKGVIEQTRRHAFLSSMLGIPHMVVCVNKMDLVDWGQDRFERDQVRLHGVRRPPQRARHHVHPDLGAARATTSSTAPSTCGGTTGRPLLNHLESVYIGSDENFIDPRFPVQYVIRSQTPENPDFRGYAGTVASGVLRPGDELLVLPSGTTSRIASIVTADGEVAEAFPPMAVVITLADDIAISRGDVLCRPNNRPTLTSDIEATVCWMDERSPLTVGRSYLVKHSTRTVRATAQSLQYRLDINGLHRDEAADCAGPQRDRPRHASAPPSPSWSTTTRTNRTTGSFILIDPSTNATVGRRGDPGDRHRACQPQRGASRAAA